MPPLSPHSSLAMPHIPSSIKLPPFNSNSLTLSFNSRFGSIANLFGLRRTTSHDNNNGSNNIDMSASLISLTKTTSQVFIGLLFAHINTWIAPPCIGDMNAMSLVKFSCALGITDTRAHHASTVLPEIDLSCLSCYTECMFSFDPVPVQILCMTNTVACLASTAFWQISSSCISCCIKCRILLDAVVAPRHSSCLIDQGGKLCDVISSSCIY